MALKEGELDEIALFDQLHDEYCRLIERFVQENSTTLSKSNGLFNSDNGMVETILYPIRTFSILGALSYLAFFYGDTGNTKRERELVSLIEEIINKNPSVLTPATDWLRKDIAITIVELCRNQRDLLAKKWIITILNNLHKRYLLSGWVPSKSTVPEEIIEDTFHFKDQKVPRPTSSLIPLLFQSLKLDLPAVYEKYPKCFMILDYWSLCLLKSCYR
jgi:hypothetical protein